MPFALVCKQTNKVVAKRLDESIALDGTIEARAFAHRYHNHSRSLLCSRGHAFMVPRRIYSSRIEDPDGCAHPQRRGADTAPRKTCRIDRIKQITFYDVRPFCSWQRSPAPDDITQGHTSKASRSSASGSTSTPFEVTSVKIIGFVFSLLPNFESLSANQCLILLNMALAYAISVYAPKLRRLTLRSPHVDASALAMLLQNLTSLEELEVGRVKTCWCRGSERRQEGARDLAHALRGAAKLDRLVFNSSTVTAVDGELLFKLPA